MHDKTSWKKHGRWSSSNHQRTFGSLWVMWKEKVQETPFPSFEIEGTMTTQFGSFQSGQNASSLHWQIQVYCNLLRWLLILWGHVLPQKEKRWVRCIQAIQGLGRKTTQHHIKMQMIWSWRRVPIKWMKNIHDREWNWNPNVHARYSTTKWTSRKVPANHRKWSWGHAASSWLIQWFLDICYED